MTWYTGLVFGLWATFLCLFSVVPSTAGRGRLIRVPVAENHRGKEVPLSLGLGLAAMVLTHLPILAVPTG